MQLGNVILGSLNVNDGTSYALDDETWLALEAAVPARARLVESALRYPYYVGDEVLERSLNLVVWFLAQDALDRKVAYDALVVATASPDLIPLTWSVGSTSRRVDIHNGGFVASDWFMKATAQAVIPNASPLSL